MKTSKEDFGWRLKEILFYHRKSTTELAVILGLTRQSINLWTQGNHYPPLKKVFKLLAAFPDINPMWFLTGEGEKGFS